jgi:hypothetical protein
LVKLPIYEKAALESGITQDNTKSKCEANDKCKAYFDSHHPSYEASLCAGPAFKRGVLHKISADKDVDPYRSSMSKGAYFTVIVCDFGEKAYNGGVAPDYIGTHEPRCVKDTQNDASVLSLDKHNIYKV